MTASFVFGEFAFTIEMPNFKSAVSSNSGKTIDIDALHQQVDKSYEIVEYDESHIIWKIDETTGNYAFIFADGRMAVASVKSFNLDVRANLEKQLKGEINLLNAIGVDIKPEEEVDIIEHTTYYSEEAEIYQRVKFSYNSMRNHGPWGDVNVPGMQYELKLSVPECHVESGRLYIMGTELEEVVYIDGVLIHGDPTEGRNPPRGVNYSFPCEISKYLTPGEHDIYIKDTSEGIDRPYNLFIEVHTSPTSQKMRLHNADNTVLIESTIKSANIAQFHKFLNITAELSQAVLRISPATEMVNVGDEFTLDIVVEDAQNLFGASFELAFDGSVLEATDATPGDLLGEDVIFFKMPGTNTISVSITKKAGSSPASGTGVLAAITFKAKAVGTTDLSFVRETLTLQQANGSPIAGFDRITIEGASVTVGGPRTFDITYVDASIGSDDYDGSSAVYQGGNIGPKATIQAGIDATKNGGTCYVAAGTYPEAVIITGEIIMPTGKPGDISFPPIIVEKKISLIGAGADCTIIEGTEDSNNIVTLIAQDNTSIIQGFAIVMPSSAKNCGVYCQDSSLTIANNIIVGHDSSVGIACAGSSSPNVVNNTIVNMLFGIVCDDSSSPLIVNNIIANNIAGISLDVGSSRSPVISYNDFWNNGYDYYDESANGPFSPSPGTGEIHAKPQFVGAGDYHLKPTSPCIDAGDPNPIYSDPDGSRNDMGAYGGPNARGEVLRPGVIMRFSPAEMMVNVPDQFVLEVVLENATNLFGASFELIFDGNILQAIEAIPGDFLGDNVIFFKMLEANAMSVSISKKAGSMPAMGTGLLAKVTFKAKKAGTTDIRFRPDTLSLQQADGEPIPQFETLDLGECHVIVEHETEVKKLEIISDSSWRASQIAQPGWETISFDDSDWGFSKAPWPGFLTWYSPIDQGMWAASETGWGKDSGASEAYFRKTFILDGAPIGEILSAVFQINIDNSYKLYINGTFIGSDDNWRNMETYDVRSFLRWGKNVIAIHAIDSGGYEGVSLKFDVEYVRHPSPPVDFNMKVEPEEATVAIGGQGDYKISVTNLSPVKGTFTLSVSDNLESSLYTLSRSSLEISPGETQTATLEVHIPDDYEGAELINFDIYAEFQGHKKSVSCVLRIGCLIHNPLPEDDAMLTSNDVIFSWDTNIAGTSEVYLKAEGEADYTLYTGDEGKSHTVTVPGLKRDTRYSYYAKSACKTCTMTSKVRSFYIKSGIAFTKDVYSFTVERDYNQRVTVAVSNIDSQPHDLRVTVENPYSDIAIGFVGEGSESEVIPVNPGESKDVVLVVHAQDTQIRDYQFLAKLQSIAAEETLLDTAILKVHVDAPLIDYEVIELGTEPGTLVKNYKITNHGDTITDLKVTADENLKDTLIFQPSIQHARLSSGSSIEFQAIPILSVFAEDPSLPRSGNITVTCSDSEKTIEADFDCPPEKLHPVPKSMMIIAKAADWYCTNRPHIEFSFNIPAGFDRNDIEKATLLTTFTPKSGWHHQPHDVNLSLNGHPIGKIEHSIPSGPYFFDIVSEDVDNRTYFIIPETGVAKNTIQLDTPNINRGHYVVASDFELHIVLKEITLYACADSWEEAEAIIERQTSRYFVPQPDSWTIQITSPAKGQELDMGVPFVIQASSPDNVSGLYVVANFSNGDSSIRLDDQGNGDYSGEWTPQKPGDEGTGEVTITVTAGACRNGRSEVTVRLINKPPDLTLDGLWFDWSEAGEPIDVFPKTIINQGGSLFDSPTVKLTIWDNPQDAPKWKIGSKEISTKDLVPGKPQIYLGGIPWTPSATGKHTMEAMIDSENQVTETNETNNTVSADVTIPLFLKVTHRVDTPFGYPVDVKPQIDRTDDGSPIITDIDITNNKAIWYKIIPIVHSIAQEERWLSPKETITLSSIRFELGDSLQVSVDETSAECRIVNALEAIVFGFRGSHIEPDAILSLLVPVSTEQQVIDAAMKLSEGELLEGALDLFWVIADWMGKRENAEIVAAILQEAGYNISAEYIIGAVNWAKIIRFFPLAWDAFTAPAQDWITVKAIHGPFKGLPKLPVVVEPYKGVIGDGTMISIDYGTQATLDGKPYTEPIDFPVKVYDEAIDVPPPAGLELTYGTVRDFNPSPVVFDRPATISIPVIVPQAVPTDTLKTYRFNEATSQWELAGDGGMVWDGTASVNVNQLGRYAVMRKVDDTIHPAILSTLPEENATEVPINSQVTITFSEVMFEDTLNSLTMLVFTDQNEPIEGEIFYNHQHNELTFTPHEFFNPGDTITVIVTSDAKDVSGNPLDGDIEETRLPLDNFFLSFVVEAPPWDVNKDSIVDISDLVIVGMRFGEEITAPAEPNPDLNGDGIVDISDLILVELHFGEEYERLK